MTQPAVPRPLVGRDSLSLFLLLILIGIAGISAAVRFSLIGSLELFPDEALYVWISEKLPFTFCPHPPGVPLLAGLGIQLLGKNEFGVRLGSFVLSLLTYVPVYLLGKQMGGSRVGFWSVVTFSAVPLFFALGVITTPDAPQLFFWAVALVLTWQALQSGKMGYWIAAGLTVGIGLHFKYILILYYPSLLVALAIVPEWRPQFRAPGIYLNALLAFFVFVPLAAYGDYRTDWSALRYHLAERQSFVPPSISDIAAYQAVHAGYLSPLIYFGAIGAVFLAGRNQRRTGAPREGFLFSFAAVPYLFFLVVSFFTERDLSREQWDAPAYLPAIIAMVVLVVNKSSVRKVRWFAVSGLVVGYLTILLVIVEGLTGRVTGLLGETPAFSSLLGWRTMAREADRQIDTLHKGAEPFFLGNSFHLTLEYAFYGKATDRVYTLDHSSAERYGLTALLEQTGASQTALNGEIGRNGVFVAMSSAGRSSRGMTKDVERVQKLKPFFDRIEGPDTYTTERFGRVLKYFHASKCYNFNGRETSASAATISATRANTAAMTEAMN